MYQIAHLGDDDDEPEFSSAMELEEGTTFFFSPRGLKNLVLVDELESLAPIMSCQVLICDSDKPIDKSEENFGIIRSTVKPVLSGHPWDPL